MLNDFFCPVTAEMNPADFACLEQNPKCVSIRKCKMHKTAIHRLVYTNTDTNHTTYIKSSRFRQKIPNNQEVPPGGRLSSRITHSAHCNNLTRVLLLTLRVAIFAFHFSFGIFLSFLPGAKGSPGRAVSHDDSATCRRQVTRYHFKVAHFCFLPGLGSLNSFHSLFHFGYLLPGPTD